MYDDFRENEWAEEDGRYGRLGKGCFVLLSIFLVVVLVGVFIPTLLWFFSTRENNPPVLPPTSTPAFIAEETTGPPPTSSPAPTAPPTPTAVAPIPQNTSQPLFTAEADVSVNRIAFISSDGQLMTVNKDGTNLAQVTRGRQHLRFPAWSPDGTKIAAIGSTGAAAAVYVVDAAAQRSQPVSLYVDRENAPFYLYWLPDSARVSFLSSHPAGLALQVVPVDGGEESRVVATGSPFYWNWAADGEQLLIHSGDSGRDARLELLGINGEGQAVADPGFFQTPVISANGRYWAFAEQVRGGSQIVIVDNATGDHHVLKHDGIAAMGWNPDADVLAFISGGNPERDGVEGPLRLVDAQTGEVTELSKENVIAFFWSPDGRYLAAFSFRSSLRNPGDISAQAKGQSAKPARQFSLPTLDLTIFDLVTGEGRVILEYTPTLTFLTQFLPFFDQYALSHHIWSPQSDALVLPMQDGSTSQIVIVPTKGGQTRPIGEGQMPFWSQN